jgi:hypothetical protein
VTCRTGDLNSCPPDLELGALTKWLASLYTNIVGVSPVIVVPKAAGIPLAAVFLSSVASCIAGYPAHLPCILL